LHPKKFPQLISLFHGRKDFASPPRTQAESLNANDKSRPVSVLGFRALDFQEGSGPVFDPTKTVFKIEIPALLRIRKSGIDGIAGFVTVSCE
jgi:hypothetical protein